MFKLLKVQEAKKEIEALNQRIEAYKEQLQTIEVENIEANELIAELHGLVAEKELEIDGLNTLLADSVEKIKKLQDNNVEATAAAAAIVAELGAEEPVEQETAADKTNEQLNDEFNGLTDPAAKVEFYRKHRNQLLNKE
jgi:uncharacterized coiled-coil protein SlyX